jgi:peptidyl-prolyl cis-trans isomerase A (cyclophilin A)
MGTMLRATLVIAAMTAVACNKNQGDQTTRGEGETRGETGGASAPATRTTTSATTPATGAGTASAVDSVQDPGDEIPPALLNPNGATEQAPDEYVVKLETTKGDIVIDVHRDWAPKGADRFYNLVKIGFFNDVAVFRVIDGFMAQTGLSGHPRVNAAWRMARIEDDPPKEHNTRGMVTFATSGPNSRTTQFFINFGDNSRLDGMGFAPFGKVRDMATVDALYDGYGEGAPSGRGPAQMRIQTEGNRYLRAEFPQLDYIRTATIVEN